MQSTIGERNLKSALIGIGVLYRVVSNGSGVIYLYGNGILLKGQTIGHLIVQNVVGGVTIGHVDGGLEVYGIANVAVVALTPRAGSVLNFLCHSGDTVLFLDGHFFCSGINGADRIVGTDLGISGTYNRIFDRLYCKECTGTDTGRYVGSEDFLLPCIGLD